MPRKPLPKSADKKGWRFVQSKRRQNTRTKFALVILALLIGVLIISGVARVTQRLFNPPGGTVQKRSFIWDGQFNINLMVKAADIALLSYSPKEGKITIINLPNELFLEAPYGFGKWQLGAVYELGQQSQKEGGGDRLLKDTLANLFALPVDGFLNFGLQQEKSTSEIVEILRKNPFSGWNLLSSLKTDLTLWEMLRLKISLSGVRFDKVKEIDLKKRGILEEDHLPDGTAVFAADPVKLDSALLDLADPTVVSEHKTIAVFNATEKAALAGKWARVITNLGGNVIITGNAGKILEKTRVEGEESLTLKRMRQIFDSLDCQKKQSLSLRDNPECDTIGSLDKVSSSRAQINLILGEDFLKKD